MKAALLTVLLLVAVACVACQPSEPSIVAEPIAAEPQTVPHAEPLAEPHAEPHVESPTATVPESGPQGAPVEGGLVPTDGTILFAVYSDTGCQVPLFTATLQNDFESCQSATALGVTAYLNMGCFANGTLVGRAYAIVDHTEPCSTAITNFPNSPSGDCTIIPTYQGANAVRGYCPGFLPPETPVAPPSAASSLFISVTLVALALIGSFIY